MNANRLVSLLAAVLITATEWAAFSSVVVHSQSVVAAVDSDASDPALPVIVVTAHRRA